MFENAFEKRKMFYGFSLHENSILINITAHYFRTKIIKTNSLFISKICSISVQ